MRRCIRGVVGAGVSAISLLTLFTEMAHAQTPSAAPAPRPAPVAAQPPTAAAPVAPPVVAAPPPAAPPVVAAPPPAAAPQPGSPLAPVAPAQPQPVPPAPPPAVQPQPVLTPPAPVQPQPAQPVQPTPVQPQPAPTPEPAQPAALTPAPVSGQVVLSPADASVAPPPPINLQPPPIEPVTDTPTVAWYDQINAKAFIDSYAAWNPSNPKPQDRSRFRAFDYAYGFALAWAGLDLELPGDSVGGTLALRFGPSAARLAGADAAVGLQYVKQAFATWRPGGKDSAVTLDFGKFDTIFGAEVADSQLNFNYTRGLLYWLAQPAFHTGVRANIDIVDEFWITALVANGWNNSLDNNFGKSLGVQFSTAVGASDDAPPLFDAHLGYLVGPEAQDWGTVPNFCPAGQGFDPLLSGCAAPVAGGPSYSPSARREAASSIRHLIDLVVGAHPTSALALSLNADLGLDQWRDPASLTTNAPELPAYADQLWWGASVAGRYQFSTRWAAALRGEILGDPDGRMTFGDDPAIQNVKDLVISSGTLTGEFAPAEALVFRLDARVDATNKDVFPSALRSYSGVQFTTTLGAVVTTN